MDSGIAHPFPPTFQFLQFVPALAQFRSTGFLIRALRIRDPRHVNYYDALVAFYWQQTLEDGCSFVLIPVPFDEFGNQHGNLLVPRRQSVAVARM